MQETCVSEKQQLAFEREAAAYGKKAICSPLDPEHIKASAGVAALAVKGIEMYPATKVTDDYRDALATGRCNIFCFDIGGQTLVCANIYGWTGGSKGSKEAERTDDIISIVRMQFRQMPPGPKLICGDLNACTEALPTLKWMLKEEGWTDVGNNSSICRGEQGKYTCHARAGAKESRLDYFITNDQLTPAVRSFWLDLEANYPTHCPIYIAIATSKLVKDINQLIKPTNFAALFQDKVDEDIARKQEEAESQAETKGEEPKPVDSNAIRKTHLARLHDLIDKHLGKREFRLLQAKAKKDTDRQWQLIAAAVEDANIEFHLLEGKDAKKMRGRSKVTFQKKRNRRLKEKPRH